MASRFLSPFAGARGLGRSDPFLDLHREVNRLFDDVFRGATAGQGGGVVLAPSIDVHETDDALVVTAEVPGVAKQDIDLRLEGDLLTIRGEKHNERRDERAHLVERAYGSFQRSIRLPFVPDPNGVTADCTKGVLTIRLPRAEAAERSRKIQIGTGNGEQGSRTIEGQAQRSASPSGPPAGAGAAGATGGAGQQQGGASDLAGEQADRGEGEPA